MAVLVWVFELLIDPHQRQTSFFHFATICLPLLPSKPSPLTLNDKSVLARCGNTPTVLVAQEAEAGGPLELRNLRPDNSFGL